MKLRLENGNFTIKMTAIPGAVRRTYKPLPKGLKPIDFVGAVIEDTLGGYTNVIHVYPSEENESLIVLGIPNDLCICYNPLNGKVGESSEDIYDDDSSDEGGTDDSGSGGEVGK